MEHQAALDEIESFGTTLLGKFHQSFPKSNLIFSPWSIVGTEIEIICHASA